MGDLEQRVEKLERGNRRLKMVGGVVAAVLMAAALVGAVLPQEIPEVVDARVFRVLDGNGTGRAMMHDVGIEYYDENGTARVWIGADGIEYYDEDGDVIWQAPR